MQGAAMGISDRLSNFLRAYKAQLLTSSMEALNELGFSDEQAAKFLNNLSSEKHDTDSN